MPRTPDAHINPSLLTWARETVGYTADELAKKLKCDPQLIYAWENGEGRPSIAKLKRISEILKRPLATFYLPAPPEDRRPPKDFRGLIPGHAGHFSHNLHLELRLAESKREDALSLIEALEREPPKFTLKASLDTNPEIVAESLFQALNLSREDILRSKTAYDARKLWKTSIERCGALVFQVSRVDISEMRGFALAHDVLPVMAINGKDAPNGQIFSMLHELTHLALHQTGICDFSEDLPRSQADQDVEVFCNHVAGAMLVPSKLLLSHSIVRERAGLSEEWSDDLLQTISNDFSCSREVVLRRLLIHGLTTSTFYTQKRESFAREYAEKSAASEKIPVKFFRKVINSNGFFLSKLAVESYQREVITGVELSRMLHMKLKHLPELAKSLEGQT